MKSTFFSKKLVTIFMNGGKKSKSEHLVRKILYLLKLAYGPAYKEVFERAFLNLTPKISLKNKRKAGVSYKIPFALRKGEASTYAIRWLKQASLNRSEADLQTKVYKELVEASSGYGEAVRKKESVHQTALLNRALIKLLR